MAHYPTTVVLFGATGDLARRKLLPGMLHLFQTGLLPELRVVGTSLDDHDRESFVALAREAAVEFSGDDGDIDSWDEFAKLLHWAPGADGPAGLRAAVEAAESGWTQEAVRLHYLSVPPSAALSVAISFYEPRWSMLAYLLNFVRPLTHIGGSRHKAAS